MHHPFPTLVTVHLKTLAEERARPKMAVFKVEREDLQGCRDSSSSYLELSRQVSHPALKVSQLCGHRPLCAAVGAGQGWAYAMPAWPSALLAGARAAHAARCDGSAARIMTSLPPGPQAVV